MADAEVAVNMMQFKREMESRHRSVVVVANQL